MLFSYIEVKADGFHEIVKIPKDTNDLSYQCGRKRSIVKATEMVIAIKQAAIEARKQAVHLTSCGIPWTGSQSPTLN